MKYTDEQRTNFLLRLISDRLKSRKMEIKVALGGYTDRPTYKLMVTWELDDFKFKLLHGKETPDVTRIFSEFLKYYFWRLDRAVNSTEDEDYHREFVSDFGVVGSESELDLVMTASDG